MQRIQLDLERLRRSGQMLDAVRVEFEEATANAHGVAEAVGHRGLSAAITRFAESWDDRRADMTENIAALGQAASGIAEAFGDLDVAYAASLEGTSPPPASATPRRADAR